MRSLSRRSDENAVGRIVSSTDNSLTVLCDERVFEDQGILWHAVGGDAAPWMIDGARCFVYSFGRNATLVVDRAVGTNTRFGRNDGWGKGWENCSGLNECVCLCVEERIRERERKSSTAMME